MKGLTKLSHYNNFRSIYLFWGVFHLSFKYLLAFLFWEESTFGWLMLLSMRLLSFIRKLLFFFLSSVLLPDRKVLRLLSTELFPSCIWVNSVIFLLLLFSLLGCFGFLWLLWSVKPITCKEVSLEFLFELDLAQLKLNKLLTAIIHTEFVLSIKGLDSKLNFDISPLEVQDLLTQQEPVKVQFETWLKYSKTFI